MNRRLLRPLAVMLAMLALAAALARHPGERPASAPYTPGATSLL